MQIFLFSFLILFGSFNALAQASDCDQGDDTNHFESGYNITSTSVYTATDDFFVSPDNTLNIQSIELEIQSLRISDPIETIDLYFYNDDNGYPGSTVVETITGITPYAQIPIGSADGFNIFSVLLEVAIAFEGGQEGAGYWIHPVANAPETVYWGTTTIGTLGEPIHTRRDTDPWNPDSDGEQAVFKLYCDVATPPDPVCMFDIAVDVIPITRINFAGIDNRSSPEINATPYLEDFTDILGHVEPGETYTFILEGNTNGNYDHFSTVWIDWNQNEEYEEDEMYVIGRLTNSNGMDGMQVSIDIEVPEDAELGTTTFRVAKIWDVTPNNPCGSYLFGQGEEYGLEVERDLGFSDQENLIAGIYPNPVEDMLYFNTKTEITSISVYTLLGQEMMHTKVRTNEINLNHLSKGMYIVRATLAGGTTESFKIIKE